MGVTVSAKKTTLVISLILISAISYCSSIKTEDNQLPKTKTFSLKPKETEEIDRSNGFSIYDSDESSASALSHKKDLKATTPGTLVEKRAWATDSSGQVSVEDVEHTSSDVVGKIGQRIAEAHQGWSSSRRPSPTTGTPTLTSDGGTSKESNLLQKAEFARTKRETPSHMGDLTSDGGGIKVGEENEKYSFWGNAYKNAGHSISRTLDHVAHFPRRTLNWGTSVVPLRLAVRYRQVSLVKRLLQKIAKMDEASKLQIFLAKRGLSACFEGDRDAQRICKKKKDGVLDRPLLNLATQWPWGSEDVVDALLGFIGDMAEHSKFLIFTAKDERGRTPLQVAIRSGRQAVVEALLGVIAKMEEEHKYPILTATDETGDNPLHLAVSRGDVKVVNALLTAMGDKKYKYMTTINRYNYTPLQLALRDGHLHVVNALLSAIAKMEDASKLSILMAKDGGGSTALERVISRGDLETLDTLLTVVGKMDEESKLVVFEATDEKGNTPLHLAAEGGKVELVKALLKAMGDEKKKEYVKMKNQANETPIEVASAKANETPIDVARAKGHAEIAALLRGFEN